MTSKPPIDSLTLLSRFAREHRISLRDPNLSELFLMQAKADIDAALQHDALLHGQRTQNMFEALVVSLGKYKLFKLEDIGIVHPNREYTAPDFRVVLEDGTQWLIEVKNAHSIDPRKQEMVLRARDVEKVVRYSEAVGVSLKWAIYWSRWRIWTLTDTERFDSNDKKLAIAMQNAIPASQLGKLGDRTIGTLPNLSLRFETDPQKTRSIDGNGEVEFTIGSVKLFCGGKEIVLPVERDIAWIFMQYSDWECGEPTPIVSGNELHAIEFAWTPKSRENPQERFEILGTLSTMFAHYYAEKTVADGNLIQTEAGLVPNWFRPLVDKTHKSDAFPLWLFELSALEN